MAMYDYLSPIKELSGLGLKTLISQPFEFVKVLMTIGYELPPQPDRQAYPNIMLYATHVYEVDGVAGFIPGLKAKLIIALLQYATTKILRHCILHCRKDDNHQPEQDMKQRIKINILESLNIIAGELTHSITNILITYPFHVVACRMMAQFVGKETKYVGVLNSLLLIYEEQGIDGLYSGVEPFIVREVIHIAIVRSIIFLMKTAFGTSEKVGQITALHVNMISRHFTYALQVASTCLALHDSDLKVGRMPYFPDYDGNWLVCYNTLLEKKEQHRGLQALLGFGSSPKKVVVLSNSAQNVVINALGPDVVSDAADSIALPETELMTEDVPDEETLDTNLESETLEESEETQPDSTQNIE